MTSGLDIIGSVDHDLIIYTLESPLKVISIKNVQPLKKKLFETFFEK